MTYQNRKDTVLRHALVLIVLSICTLLVSCDEKVTLGLVHPVPPEETVDDPIEEMMPVEPIALPGLPADVTGYNQWLKLNAKPIPPTGGGDPHRGTKDVYVNQERDVIAPGGGQRFPYPDGIYRCKGVARRFGLHQGCCHHAEEGGFQSGGE